MSNYMKTLEQLNADSLPEAGGKGANLGVLIHAGLPVPPGFVVTTHAYRAHLEASELQHKILKRLEQLQENDLADVEAASMEITGWIEEAPVPAAVQEEAGRAWEQLLATITGNDAGKPLAVAVRSSATAEDLPSASFAGQHDTYLGVYGKAETFQYIKKCWASLWSAPAISYRISMGFEHLEVDLAVVVQAMIDSEVAGVMFTANPINGRRDEIMISAGYGLGESVVSGLINPDTFILNKQGEAKQQTLGSKQNRIVLTATGTVTEEVPSFKRSNYSLNEAELNQLALLANKVEQHCGGPQDTEWALFNGKIYLLQARPITTLDNDSEGLNVLEPGDQVIYQGKEAPFGLQSVMEHSPHPHKPLDFASFQYFYQGINDSFEQSGFAAPEQETKPVERASGVVALDYHSPRLPLVITWEKSDVLDNELARNKEKQWLQVVVEIKNWIEQMNLSIQNTCGGKQSVELLQKALIDYKQFVHQRFNLMIAPGEGAEPELDKYIIKVAGKEQSDEWKERLLRALPFRTALQNNGLIQLARIMAQSGRDSQAFHSELDHFLQEYGDRPSIGSGRMITPMTWHEDPQLIDELITMLGSIGQDGKMTLFDPDEIVRQQTDDLEATKMLVQSKLSPGDYMEFLELLEQVRNTVIIREESVFYLEKLAGCLHRIALKLGHILVKQKVIDEQQDVFFLFLEELPDSVKKSESFKERIDRRKAGFAKVMATHNKGIHWMISTGSFPVFETESKNQSAAGKDANVIQGSPASRGEYEGTVCMVRNTSEFSKLKKGDILVSPYTIPIWTPLFKIAAAVVTEIGSASSHAAIVAREYNIPAVVAIDNICNLLQDGQHIRVNGTKGTITFI